MTKTFALAAAAALALAAPLTSAPLAHAQPDNCFNMNTLNNTHVADPHTVYLRSGANKIYRLEFANACNTAPNETLIVRSEGSDNQICKPIQLDIRVARTGERCIATGLTRLTPDEAAGLPANVRP